ncbi:hypothetical protein Q5O24_06700 [Eubacteriaceae bacterium ES3]|nr:hypothetical protein Q5O24_06700 [Eubacteriaceae bacterium ES3]
MKRLKTLISVMIALMLVISFTGNFVFAENAVITLVENDIEVCEGIAVDSLDHIYYAERDLSFHSYNLSRMDADGQNKIVLAGGFSDIRDIAVDVTGNIYLTAFYSHSLIKLDENGGSKTEIYTCDTDKYIYAIDADSHGNIYFTEAKSFPSYDAEIKKIDPDNNVTLIASGYSAARGLVIDSEDLIYFTAANPDLTGRSIYQMDINGENIAEIAPIPNDSMIIAVDSEGFIYFSTYESSSSSYAIMKMNESGDTQLLASGFPNVFGIETDSSGNLYFSDFTTIKKLILAAPSPVIVTQPVSQTVDLDESVILSVVAEEVASGTLTYQWFVADSEVYEPATAIEGATNPNYSPDTSLAGTVYYFCQVTNTESSGLSATTASEIAVITVNEEVVIEPTPETEIAEMIDTIESNITDNYSKSLISKLENIQTKIDNGKYMDAANQLHAFINSVNAQTGKKIDFETSEYLVIRANSIIQLIAQ